MYKIIILVVLTLLMATIVSAEDFRIDDVRIYVDNDRANDVDEEGGMFTAYRGQIIDVVISVRNEMDIDTRARINAVLEGINRGTDLDKEIDWFEVRSEDDETESLSFTVPSDTNYELYDLELRIEYEDRNDTVWTIRQDYEVEVEQVVINEEEKVMSLLEYINTSQKQMLNKIDEYVNTNTNLSEEIQHTKNRNLELVEQLNITRLKLEDYKHDLSNLNETLDTKEDQIRNLQSQLNNKENQMKNMITAQAHQEAITDIEKQQQNMILIGVVVIVAFMIIQNKRKKDQSVGDNIYVDG